MPRLWHTKYLWLLGPLRIYPVVFLLVAIPSRVHSKYSIELILGCPLLRIHVGFARGMVVYTMLREKKRRESRYFAFISESLPVSSGEVPLELVG
jgi:hypothetical protein